MAFFLVVILFLALKIFGVIWCVVFPIIIAYRIFTDRIISISSKIGWLIFDFLLPPVGSVVYALKYEHGILWQFAYIARIAWFIGLALLAILFMTGRLRVG